MSTRRRIVVGGAALAMAAAWEQARRRDWRSIKDDPEWDALHEPLGAQPRTESIFGAAAIGIRGWLPSRPETTNHQIRSRWPSYSITSWQA